MNVRFEVEALEEFEKAAAFYREVDQELAQHFRDTIKQAIDDIADHPMGYAIYVDDIRRKVVFSFPYLIFYVTSAMTVTIVAVMHQRREPDYWARRRD